MFLLKVCDGKKVIFSLRQGNDPAAVWTLRLVLFRPRTLSTWRNPPSVASSVRLPRRRYPNFFRAVSTSRRPHAASIGAKHTATAKIWVSGLCLILSQQKADVGSAKG